jgi:hypothetical protein
MTKQDLMSEAFKNLNAFKRSRALEAVAREKGDSKEAHFQRMRQYETIDRLELSLRALQRDSYVK